MEKNPARRKILKNKYYLYLTEFFAGMSVMAVELGASRLLAPYFSSSQIVWTIIIGTIMIAMALGNIWGGRAADRNPDPDRLYRRLLIAAVWIALIPLVGKYIILGVSALLIFTVSTNFLTIAAFAVCMILFVFPLFLLGTVTPSLAKYTVDNLEENGKIVGTLGAFNTIGSIIGTFLPTFVTIPAVGTAVTFLVFAGILLLLALIYFLSEGRRRGLCTAALILFVVCSVFGNSGNFAFWEQNLRYEGESVYNYLQVKDAGDSVILSTNVLFGVQSVMKKDDGLTGMYYDTAMAAPLMAAGEVSGAGEPSGTGGASGTGEPSGTGGASDVEGISGEGGASDAEGSPGAADEFDMLILGMGSGTYARQCRAYFGDMNIEGVEIDEKITQLSRTYFDLPEDVTVYTYDGRAYLQAVERKYDVIMVDAYQDITIPFQMSSREFFEIVKAHLKDGGVMVVNMNMYSNEEGNINDYLIDTIASVFGTVYTSDVSGTTNRELFASQNPEIADVFHERIPDIEDRQLRQAMQRVEKSLVKQEKGEYILTDDKAPVELLGIQVIDGLIQRESQYYKKILQEEGVSGLLASFG